MTKIEKKNQAPQVFLTPVVDPEVSEITINMDNDLAQCDEGLVKPLQLLDHFKPNLFTRKLSRWGKLKKTGAMSWMYYTKEMMRLRADRS